MPSLRRAPRRRSARRGRRRVGRLGHSWRLARRTVRTARRQQGMRARPREGARGGESLREFGGGAAHSARALRLRADTRCVWSSKTLLLVRTWVYQYGAPSSTTPHNCLRPARARLTSQPSSLNQEVQASPLPSPRPASRDQIVSLLQAANQAAARDDPFPSKPRPTPSPDIDPFCQPPDHTNMYMQELQHSATLTRESSNAPVRTSTLAGG